MSKPSFAPRWAWAGSGNGVAGPPSCPTNFQRLKPYAAVPGQGVVWSCRPSHIAFGIPDGKAAYLGSAYSSGRTCLYAMHGPQYRGKSWFISRGSVTYALLRWYGYRDHIATPRTSLTMQQRLTHKEGPGSF